MTIKSHEADRVLKNVMQENQKKAVRTTTNLLVKRNR